MGSLLNILVQADTEQPGNTVMIDGRDKEGRMKLRFTLGQEDTEMTINCYYHKEINVSFLHFR